jgi:hypothetical protein
VIFKKIKIPINMRELRYIFLLDLTPGILKALTLNNYFLSEKAMQKKKTLGREHGRFGMYAFPHGRKGGGLSDVVAHIVIRYYPSHQPYTI